MPDPRWLVIVWVVGVVDIYGPFNSQGQARAWAERQLFSSSQRFTVHSIIAPRARLGGS